MIRGMALIIKFFIGKYFRKIKALYVIDIAR